MYCLHRQDLWINQAGNQQESGAKGTCYWLFAWQTFRQDDGRILFFRNFGVLLPVFTASHPRSYCSSTQAFFP
jgi:hypothetical protein